MDLFAPAMDIIERMGVLEPVLQRHTGTQRIVVRREHASRPVTIDLPAVMTAVSRRHVEIMRDDLSETFTTPPATTSSTASTTPSPR